MASPQEVEEFLVTLMLKIDIFGILFFDDRGKNLQTLLDLEITPNQRKQIIKSLKVQDYSKGPLKEKMHGILPMWIFGKQVKNREVYIKISMGVKNNQAVCISFHIAEFPMKYPFNNIS